jgi:acetylornithine deacetylase/succinyl-diaminopimelate desuccinylase-like protein
MMVTDADGRSARRFRRSATATAAIYGRGTVDDKDNVVASL